jgi:hypothetical protein
MTDEAWGFAAPPFRADEALSKLQRELRDLRLTERSGVWERKGVAIARLTPQTSSIQAERVKRPSRNSPEWQVRSLTSSAQVRDFVADLKTHLAQWSDDD